MRIAVILPCYNEEISIKSSISQVMQHIQQADIFVIDNGSTDSTAGEALSLGVTVLHEPQRGKGFAVRRAFSQLNSDYDVFFMVDGDATYGLEQAVAALELVTTSGFDMVVGTRVPIIDSQDQRHEHFRIGHEFGNRILSKLFRSLFRLEITDTLSGWRVMSKGFVKSFSGGASGFEIEAELNAHAFLISAAVTEIPVSYKGRMNGSASKLNTYKDGLRIFFSILKYFRNERPMIAFTLLSIPWMAISLALIYRVVSNYLVTKLVPNFPSLIAGVGAFIIACNFLVTGMVLERIRLQRASIARLAFNNS
jgi:glycosyltransferase involved in cell wall biosynthesis